jgi:hypothetical protein
MTPRALVGVVTLASVVLVAAAIILQGDVLAPSPDAASDAQLIAIARNTDEAREFERNDTGPPSASVDRSGRVAVDLRIGAAARLRVFIGSGLRVEGFLLECPRQPIVTTNVMAALQGGCR